MTTTTIITTTTALAARTELCKAWGFSSHYHARSAFLAALNEEAVAPASPALTFATREAYLQARAEWRARQKTIEATIRALRAQRKEGGWYEKSCRQAEGHAWSMIAEAALMERQLQKRQAGAQRQAALDAVQAA